MTSNMKHHYFSSRLFLIIILGFVLIESQSQTKSYQPVQIFGKWKYAFHKFRNANRFGNEEVNAIKASVLNFTKDKIYFNDITLIDTCFYTDIQFKSFFDRDDKESSYFHDGPLALKYSKEQLSRFIWIDFKSDKNRFRTFYLNADTLILNSIGGPTFFFTTDPDKKEK